MLRSIAPPSIHQRRRQPRAACALPQPQAVNNIAWKRSNNSSVSLLLHATKKTHIFSSYFSPSSSSSFSSSFFYSAAAAHHDLAAMRQQASFPQAHFPPHNTLVASMAFSFPPPHASVICTTSGVFMDE